VLSVFTAVLEWLQATKRVWAYIREHNLPKTKNKAIQLDGALEKALKRKTITFGSLAKALGANMKDEQWVSAPQSSKARTSTAPSDDDDDDDDEDEDEDEDDEDEGNE
jgi:chromatin remodeling complex protein RSC6